MSAVPLISISVGSSTAGGIGGHYGSSKASPLHRLPYLPQIHFQWWLAPPPKMDHPLSRQPLQSPPEGSLSYALAVQELAVAVVAFF